MGTQPYDVWYDANEVNEVNHAHVLRGWARTDLEITYGRVILAGNDEVDPVPARIVGFDESTGIITLELLFEACHSAIA